MKEITEIWAFTKCRDGKEVILGVKCSDDREVLLVGTSLNDVRLMMPVVNSIAAEHRIQVTLKRFSNPTLMGTCLPIESVTIIERDPPEGPEALSK